MEKIYTTKWQNARSGKVYKRNVRQKTLHNMIKSRRKGMLSGISYYDSGVRIAKKNGKQQIVFARWVK